MVLVPIVDRNDTIIWHKERSQIQDNDIHRVSACRITNNHWDILLAQRGLTKKHSPGYRGPAVAGTVEWDETYLENILHEIPEEIGITLTEEDLIKGPHVFSNKKNEYFVQWFLSTCDLPIESFTKEEWKVEALQWWNPNILDKEIARWEIDFLGSIKNWRKLFT